MERYIVLLQPLLYQFDHHHNLFELLLFMEHLLLLGEYLLEPLQGLDSQALLFDSNFLN